ncbi:MAG TPA: hypothetical protein VI999_03055 [Thermoplasmata archaeon]|nr:hypothetical protein [Thermoplasmata archaeon]
MSFTLYGDAAGGWGNTSTGYTNPGPTLYVYQGANVSITLYAVDSIPHNWFIDFNANNRVDPGEVSSPDFSSSTNAVVFNFTVPTDRAGPETYLCRFHVTTMRGQVVILTPPEITLYGSQVTGWAYVNNKTSSGPGPALYMLYGTNLTIHLVSLDAPAIEHTWFVDYGNDSGASGDPISGFFNSTSPGMYVYTPDRAGTFEYRCSIHPGSMAGVIVVLGNAPAPPRGLQLNLVPGIMIATIVGVLILAAFYQVRAVRAARRPK